MNKFHANKTIIKWGWFIIFLLLFPLSCVYDKEFVYINEQINALNKRITTGQESIDPKMEEMNKNIDTINSSQAGMMVEIEKLKNDIGKLSGRVEDNEHVIKQTVERDLSEKDRVHGQLANLDDLFQRVEKLEVMVKQQYSYLGLEPPEPKEIPPADGAQRIGQEAPAEEGRKLTETESYDLSLALYRDDKPEQAIEGFRKFLTEYPKSDLADNAQFWIGEGLMALKQYEQAILAYQEVIKKYSKGNKVPNAMLRQALAFLEINDKTSAKLLLQKVIKQFPKTNEAVIAKSKLDSIK